ncbi:hypothetical protein HPP92_008289 [Vanilla planifolia]|uniref:PRLI-interacting factor A n=1 Tax=Vanilla planifolia TaxID=51239 RepID=A0A835RC35_VANPL|nr:hypothetical protein HPP92_008289 [Vanilla planifolia]
MNDPSQILSRKYGMWQLQPQPQVAVPPPPTLAVAEEPIGFANPRPVFTPQGNLPGRISWKNKKAAEKRKKAAAMAPGTVPVSGPGVGVSGYKPPTLNELQFKNRVKARRFYPKKKFNRFAPFAPRNTTSFIIRAKKSGGIASLVSPCPVTPAILPTPTFSPLREQFVDMAKEEWGVDGYGSMKGLIRLRSPIAGSSRVGGGGGGDDEDDYDDDGSSESEVEEHGEVERKLDVSQFEMVCPNFGEDHGGVAAATAYLLENRVDDQDAHIARLEEENLTLKERLFLMERKWGNLGGGFYCWRLTTEHIMRRMITTTTIITVTKLMKKTTTTTRMWKRMLFLSRRRRPQRMMVEEMCAQRRALESMRRAVTFPCTRIKGS